jgi:hypothetical protein
MKWFSLWSAIAGVLWSASLAKAETAGDLVTIGGGEVYAGTDAASYELCQPGWCPLWTIQAGAIILHRSDASDDNPIAQLNGGDTPSFGWAGGPDISVARRLGSCNSLEMRYFGALEWEIEDSLSAGPASLSANYSSRLNSTELNWRRRSSDCLTWLAGFRWIELHEDLNLATDVPIIPISIDVNTNVDNHLYGGQLGVDVSLWNRASPLSVNGVLKGGVYGNFADRDLALIFNGVPVVGVEDDDSDVAFVGDIGIAAAYPLSDHVALRGGYQLLWIDGVALADEQDSQDFDTSGDVFYHGALVGLELTW